MHRISVITVERICLSHTPTFLLPFYQSEAVAIFLRHSFSHVLSTGILTCLSSTTPFGLALESDLPWEDLPGPGTLGFTVREILALFIATHFSISSCDTSSTPHGIPSSANTMLSYHNKLSIASVRHLSPVTFSAQNH